VTATAAAAAGTGTAAGATAATAAAGRATGTETVSQQHRLTELSSGARVVTEAMPSARSVALGFWVGTGARVESHDQAGLSHFIEHLIFRGTESFSSVEIDQIFDAMGAELNAATGKETTSVHARMLDDQLPRAFEVMSDMVLRPAFADVDPEREVVVEEIAMYEDDPQDKVFDVLGEAVFGEHPLGRAVIGRADVIASVTPEAIAAFHRERYVPANLVVAAAGSVEHEELVALTEAAMRDAAGPRPAPELGTPETERRICFVEKETEQFHVCLGAPGIARDDERRFALRVLDNILGGTSSSRLFQEVRDKRGLAYAVFSFATSYADTGNVGLYVGTRPEALAETLKVVGAELERFQDDPATPEELERSKENVKGRLVLSLESTQARMNRLGGAVLGGVPLLSVDAMIERIDAVSADDLRALAREFYDPAQLSAAGIGPAEGAFRDALEPVHGGLGAPA
jgi:predicted Zn-dependent peptidase